MDLGDGLKMVSLGLAVQRGAIKTERLRTAIPKAAKLTSITADPPTMVKPMASIVVMLRSGVYWLFAPLALPAVLCLNGSVEKSSSPFFLPASILCTEYNI